jgi:hypothetical protein
VRKLALSLAAAGALAVPFASDAAAQSVIPQLPDPTDCHSMNAFLHIDNVRDCDGGARTDVAPPPLPVSVQRRSDGAVCVTVSEQVPQCVGPIS